MRVRALACLYALLLLSGCASLPRPAQDAGKDEWMKAVLEYRREHLAHPEDYEIRIRLSEAERKACEDFTLEGFRDKDEGKLEDAAGQFRQALLALPNDEKAAGALRATLAQMDSRDLVRRAQALVESGNREEAQRDLNQALAENPDDADAKSLLGKLGEGEGPWGLVLSSRDPITLRFNHTDLQAAFNTIGSAFGVDFIFDPSMRRQEVTLSAQNVTFAQAMDLMLRLSRTLCSRGGPHTLLMADRMADTANQYSALQVETIPVDSVKASVMANLLKSSLDLKHLGFNDDNNTLLVRDTPEVLDLVDEIVAANDRHPAEVLMDLEILEVNRTKAEQVGLDYGKSLEVDFPTSTLNGVSNPGLGNTLGQGSYTLPSVVLNYFKQDVDGRTLAHPQVRVLDGKEAKIHVGDKVPIPAAVIQQVTGQFQTSYNYTDIGVLLDVQPRIYQDRSVEVKLSLEVSSLGANLGTPTNPAYEIGTRDADSTMLLRDGEAAVLGGLIEDNDTKTRNHLPVLGDFPLLGDILAGNVDNEGSRTEILLTITPHVVRPWDYPQSSSRRIDSGTESAPGGRPFSAPGNQAPPPPAAPTP
ncbi:MAG TPA: secretin N-terminal domain-containing protein [bacterium]|nr:secretin N-terminal domain-containing protein [bacterium]